MAKYWIRNLDHVVNKYNNRLPGAMSSVLKRAMQKAVLYVHSTVPPYPQPPAGSTYTRTGQLGRATTTEVRTLGVQVVGIIGNKMEYSPYVISDEEVGGRGPQAKVHKGRWYTLQEVVRKARQKVLSIFETELKTETGK